MPCIYGANETLIKQVLPVNSASSSAPKRKGEKKCIYQTKTELCMYNSVNSWLLLY